VAPPAGMIRLRPQPWYPHFRAGGDERIRLRPRRRGLGV